MPASGPHEDDQEVVESGAGVEVDPGGCPSCCPTFPCPGRPAHPLARHPAGAGRPAHEPQVVCRAAYVRANRLNHDVWSGPGDRYGIIASGKAWGDTLQALADLGLDQAACRALGIRLHKVAVVWPLEAQTVREFATGLQEILVVEEKRQVIGTSSGGSTAGAPTCARTCWASSDESGADHSGGEWSLPDPSGQTLLRATADLTPALIARAIGRRLQRRPAGGRQLDRAAVEAHLALLDAREQLAAAALRGWRSARSSALVLLGLSAATARPWCPEGSRAIAGIGCPTW